MRNDQEYWLIKPLNGMLHLILDVWPLVSNKILSLVLATSISIARTHHHATDLIHCIVFCPLALPPLCPTS